jgi:hypothetical protein
LSSKLIFNALYPFGVDFCSNSKIKSSHNLLTSYLSDKNYGFIKGEDGKDYFFHDSSLKDKKDVTVPIIFYDLNFFDKLLNLW